jgi:hypothetical protein
MARTFTIVNPVVTLDQLVPLFVLKNTPDIVPAKIFGEFTPKQKILVAERPLLLADQFAPLLVDIKAPALIVPAKIVEPREFTVLIFREVKPELAKFQLSPLSVDKNTPPP